MVRNMHVLEIAVRDVDVPKFIVLMFEEEHTQGISSNSTQRNLL